MHIGLHKQGGNFTLESTLRKAFWPAIVALAAFLIFGAFTAPKASAGEVIAICGPDIINEGDTVIYVAQLDSVDEGDVVEIDLNDVVGDSNITSELRFDDEEDDEWTYQELDDQTDFLNEVEVFMFEFAETTFNDEGDEVLSEDVEDLFEEIADEADIDLFSLFMEECGEDEEGFADDVLQAILDCLDQNDCDDDWTESDEGPEDETFPGDVDITPRDIAEMIAELILDDNELIFDCTDLHDEIEDWLTGEGVSANIAEDIADDIRELCLGGDFFGDVAGFVLIDVTCDDAGEFDLSFEPLQDDSEPGQIEVQCVGDVDEAEIEATPTTIEIIPARGSTFASLVTLNLLDGNGDPSGAGTTVIWQTDRCELSADGLIPDEDDPDANMISEALDVFSEFNRNNEATSAAINAFVTDLDQETDDLVEEEAFTLEEDAGDFDEGDVISAVILDCSATSTAPGTARVTACIDVDDGNDICETANVTVVGPPVAPVVLTTDQTNVRCGERVQITATIKDAAGQNVSDHTVVEAATNAGGVLGGTGAIAAEAGLVSPVSSSVGETVNGVATFWLITSELHQGTYTVIVTTGGGGAIASGGLFSTAPVSGSVTVTCGGPTTTAPTAPSPAATVRAPSTGQGITPPSTGDAGLADASGSSWALFVIAGLTVFALAGVASLKAVRR
jgi:succinate dehydrogenase flavin-adding protein (antitoxin of CptAB toxin-antitoxin module)